MSRHCSLLNAKNTVRRASVTTAFGLALLLAAPGQGEAQNVASASTWTTACGKTAADAPSCRIGQKIIDGKGRKIINFLFAQAKSGAYLEVSAPLRLYIPFGLAIQIDDGERLPMQLVECDKSGCRAVIGVASDLFASLSRGSKLTVHFMDTQSGKQIAIGGSLRGFAASAKAVIGP